MEYHGVLSNCSLPGYAWIVAVGRYFGYDRSRWLQIQALGCEKHAAATTLLSAIDKP